MDKKTYYSRNPSKEKYPHCGAEQKSQWTSCKSQTFSTRYECKSVFFHRHHQWEMSGCLYLSRWLPVLGNRRELYSIASFNISDLNRLGGRSGLGGSFGEAVGGLRGSRASLILMPENTFREVVFCAAFPWETASRCPQFWCYCTERFLSLCYALR